jgi:predicted outer membrane protein
MQWQKVGFPMKQRTLTLTLASGFFISVLANGLPARAQALFAQMMIIDHRQNEQQVTQLAAQKGLTLFDFQPSTVDVATGSQLESLSESDFDIAYLSFQHLLHQQSLQNLIFLQGQVTDPDLRDLINQTLPVIQKHIDQAGSIIHGSSMGMGFNT